MKFRTRIGKLVYKIDKSDQARRWLLEIGLPATPENIEEVLDYYYGLKPDPNFGDSRWIKEQ